MKALKGISAWAWIRGVPCFEERDEDRRLPGMKKKVQGVWLKACKFHAKKWNSEKTIKCSNVIKPHVRRDKRQRVLVVDERPRVHLWWSMVRGPLRNASCVAPRTPLPTRHVRRQGRAFSVSREPHSSIQREAQNPPEIDGARVWDWNRSATSYTDKNNFE